MMKTLFVAFFVMILLQNEPDTHTIDKYSKEQIEQSGNQHLKEIVSAEYDAFENL